MRAKSSLLLKSGDIYASRGGGGCGYGDPFSRPVGEVVADVEQGLVSVDGALQGYGVQIARGEAGKLSGDRVVTHPSADLDLSSSAGASPAAAPRGACGAWRTA